MSDDFHKQVRRASAPPSATGNYVAAVALILFGLVTSWGALSRAMFWSGWIIVALGLTLALRTRWLTRR
ncbi:MAG: hypothetical protein R3B13_07555 [Polyangiaceae bacterium]